MKPALVLLAALALLPGCASEETVVVSVGAPAEPEAPLPERLGDPDKRLAFAASLERDGNLAGASAHYGIVARQLPRGSYTRPWLSFGRVELELGHDLSARRAFETVLATVPEDADLYITNDDYREAAVLLAGLLSRANELDELTRLKARFVTELGGTVAEWPGTHVVR
jgi:hypothetical protein